MSEELFRKKSLEQFKSPDDLNDYVRVTNPGVWLLLLSIIVLLTGACLWGFFGRINSTVPVDVRVEDSVICCYATEKNSSKLQPWMTVEFSGCTAKLTGAITDDGGFICTPEEGSASDGLYTGELILESIRPADLIFD